MAEERLFEVLRPSRRIDHRDELLRAGTVTYYRDDCSMTRLRAGRVVSLQAEEAQLLVDAATLRELDAEEAADYRVAKKWAVVISVILGVVMPILHGITLTPAMRTVLNLSASGGTWTDVLIFLAFITAGILSARFGPVLLWEKKKAPKSEPDEKTGPKKIEIG